MILGILIIAVLVSSIEEQYQQDINTHSRLNLIPTTSIEARHDSTTSSTFQFLDIGDLFEAISVSIRYFVTPLDF